MRKLSSFTTATAISALMTGAAFGQAAEPFVLDTIYLNSGGLNDVDLGSEELERTNATDLQDVFATEPTISVGSSLPVSQKVYVNGVEENNLNVTIDGARQNNRIFHHSATTYIDPELLKAVRIDPGVAPADAGPGAVAGAIAFETKDVDDLLDPGLSFGGLVSTEYQTGGDALAASLALFGRKDGFEYLIYTKRADGGIRQDGDGVDITGSSTDLQSGLAKIAYNTERGDRLELSYERVEDEAERPLRADFAGLRGGTETRTYALERENVVLTFTGAGDGAMFNPTAQIAFNSTDLFTAPMPGATDAYSGTSKSLTGKLENDFLLDGGTITAGIDFYRDTTDITGETTVAFAAEEKARNVGVYAQGLFDLSDRARISAGARYDFQEFEGVDGTTYDNSGLSVNLSGDLDVTEALTLSAGASRVWGGIALAESFLFDTAWVYPDEIEPVTSRNVYVSATATLGSFDFGAKLFRTDIDNARTLYDSTTGLFGATPGQTTDLETKGFEISGGYSWNTGFARVAYAKIDSEIDGLEADSYAGRYLTTPLGDNLVFEIVNTFEPLNLTVGANAQVTFDNDLFSGGAPSGTQEGYQVLDVFAEYQPAGIEGLTIRAQIDNLFDETYTQSASYGQEFGVVTPLNEPGRNFGLFATYRF
ncbi:TonB-dependent receptor domain-containing protein [Jannaschia sp. 2305UL9-9]|uniref:TonB-dependent receptor domain-containing protein n=1 Tax=Jannaschia sp. 2305UL9-9 TaxID=3121638 RepID=UPI0035273B2B